jgi:hypothetical protein
MTPRGLLSLYENPALSPVGVCVTTLTSPWRRTPKLRPGRQALLRQGVITRTPLGERVPRNGVFIGRREAGLHPPKGYGGSGAQHATARLPSRQLREARRQVRGSQPGSIAMSYEVTVARSTENKVGLESLRLFTPRLGMSTVIFPTYLSHDF